MAAIPRLLLRKRDETAREFAMPNLQAQKLRVSAACWTAPSSCLTLAGSLLNCGHGQPPLHYIAMEHLDWWRRRSLSQSSAALGRTFVGIPHRALADATIRRSCCWDTVLGPMAI